MIQLTRISKVTITYPVSATLPDGSPTTVDAITVALLASNQRPRVDTAWQSVTFDGSTLTVKVAGPHAATAGYLTAPLGESVLWARSVVDEDVDPVVVDKFSTS